MAPDDRGGNRRHELVEPEVDAPVRADSQRLRMENLRTGDAQVQQLHVGGTECPENGRKDDKAFAMAKL
jgi:hypothetical protein